MEIFIQASGWIGMLLIVGAYFLISRKTITSQSSIYQLMNLFGAIALGINVFYLESWPALALNVVWATIAIFTLIKARQKLSEKVRVTEQ